MKSCILKSSNVHRIGHYVQGDGTPTLIALMKGGDYAYLGVPEKTFQLMCVAESAGKFLATEIKGSYAYRKATDEELLAVNESEPLLPGAPPQATVQAVQDHAGRIYPHFNNVGMVPVDVVILDPNVKIAYAKQGDAAFDLMAVSFKHPVTGITQHSVVNGVPEYIVQPGQHILIGTGIRIALHPGMAGFVMPRSGLAKNSRVSVVNTPGLIDSGYRNEVGVLFENRGDEPFLIRQYDRIAQFGIVPMLTPIFRPVVELDQTERGMGGFGSSGVAQTGDVAV